MDNVHVAIRVRPLIQREKHAEAETHWKADTQTITQVDQRGKACRKEYLFDRVFDSSETTSDVYEEIAQPILLGAMDGINGTIFAYGQTSSGKTYTMMGDRDCPGIIPCAIQEIFDNIQDTPNREFLLRVSYMELYNEGICDLLSSEKKALQIREVDKRVFVHELTEEIVTKPGDVLQLLKKGEARRHFGQTDMNERSSRSHTIFRMIIESREMADRKSVELAVKVSHLNLVDLAGSERANETKAEGTRLKEACRINQSLHQLAMVINKLSQGADFIPFRDSKLTRILQMSLGGNAKTAIICTVTPASVDQTHSTLQFASRAKTIKNKPQVNEVLSDEAMMQRQKKEIQELKRKISELEQQGELLEEKASLHEQQEHKIKILEKMILVSGGVAVPSIMPNMGSKKAKYKRRQTWCPGMGNPLSLFPLPGPTPPTIEDMSFVSSSASSPPLSVAKRAQSFSDGSDASSSGGSPSRSVASIGSNDFSSTKRLEFIEEMEHMEHHQTTEEDIFLVPLPLSPRRQKRKRRRAHVHFSINPESDSVDAECQTEEPLNTMTLGSPSHATESISLRPQEDQQAGITELHDKIRALQSTITDMEEEKRNTEELSQALSQSKEHSERLQGEVLRLEQIISSTQANTVPSKATDDSCNELQQHVLMLEGKIAGLEAAASEKQELELAYKELMEKNEELQRQVQCLEEQNALVSQLSDALCLSEDKVTELEDQAREADNRVAALTENVASLVSQLEQQGDRSDSIRTSEAEILALRAQLEERDDALFAAARQSELEVTRLQGTIKELEDALTSLETEKERLSELPKSLQEREKQLEAMRHMFQEAEDSIAKLHLEKDGMRQDLERENDRNDQARKETNEAAAKVQELEKTVQLRDEELAIVNQLLEEQQLQREEEMQDQGSPSRITSLSQEIKDLEALLDEQRTEVESLQDKLKAQHMEAESQAQESTSTIGCLSQEIKDLEALLDEQRTDVESLQDKLKAQHMEAESQAQESASTIGCLSQEIKDLEALLDEQRTEVESLQDKLKAQHMEAESQVQESATSITSLSQEIKNLEALLDEQKTEVQSLQDQLKAQHMEAQSPTQESAITIASLSQEVQELKELFEEQCNEVDTLNHNLAEQRLEAESQRQESAATISALSQQVADLEEEHASAPSDGVPTSSGEGERDSARRAQELEETHQELTRALQAREEELETLNTFLEEQAKEAEETRSNHVARIAELTALLDEQQGQIALNGAPSQGGAASEAGPSLADELQAQDWRSKARRTESELLGSVQLCEDIMEEKAKLSNQLVQIQTECKRLEGALQDKAEELGRLQELHEFTQLEAAMTQEQEVQYRSDITKLEQQLKLQANTLAEEHQKELQEFQKKLSVKDKVLESQYQQDIDELLLKLREKNQKLDALQEQNSCLSQTLSQKEQVTDELREELNSLPTPAEASEDHGKVHSPVERVDEQTQTELTEFRSSSREVIDYSEEATQVSPADLGLLISETPSEPEPIWEKMLDAVAGETASQEGALQLRIAELEAREMTLRQDCDSLSVTISSRDQEIDVLNELLQEFGQEDSEIDSDVKIAAFVQRIEHLEEQLENCVCNSQVVPPTEAFDEPLLNQELQSLTEKNTNLFESLTQAENLIKHLKGKLQSLEEALKQADNASAELVSLREEKKLLIETNLALSSHCKELESNGLQFVNGERKEGNQEMIHVAEVLKQQVQEMMAEKAEMERAADDLRIRIRDLMDTTDKLSKENQVLTELMEEQVVLKQLLHEGSTKVQELQGDLAMLKSRCQEAGEVIKNREDEIEMLRQVLGEQEEQLKATRNDYDRSISRTKELELEVGAIKQKSANQAVNREEEENETCRLRGILENMEEEVRTRDFKNLEALSKIQQLESALAANNRKNLEKWQEEAHQQSEIQRMQSFLDEQADQLRAKDETCTELEAKLQNLECVLAATNSKSQEMKSAKLQLEEEIKTLESELDTMGDEFSHHKNNFADLQTASREQHFKIKDLEDRLASHGQNSQDLEAVIAKQDEEIKVFRALLDERNQKVLNHEDKHYEMLSKIQDLESINSAKEWATEDLEETVRKRDEELQQLYTALSNQEGEFQAQFSELKAQLQSDKDSLSSQEVHMRQLHEEVEERGKEITSLRQQLQEFHQQKSGFMSEVSKKEEEVGSMRLALQEYQSQNEKLTSETQTLEAQLNDLQTQLTNTKASPNLSEDVIRLQKEKTEIQSRLDQVSRKLQRKTADLEKLGNVFDTLQQTCSELEDEFDEEKAQHSETKKRMQEVEACQARLQELEGQNATVEELVKTHKQKLAEKNLRINQLETDLLRGTDPLEDKIRSLRSEVCYQETKVKQYKKEIEKLRSQAPQNGGEASDNASASSAARPPEATGGSGIIESCAIFAIKAENHKLTKSLEKTKRELGHQELKYHNEVSKKTQAEHDVQYWKEKARSLASHLKRAPSSQTTEAVPASPLKERDANDPTSHHSLSKRPKRVERIPDLHRPSTVGAPSPQQHKDRNWLSKAVAERDAAEAGKEKDDPQQCATQ